MTDLTEKSVRVVPSTSLPGGLTSLTAFSFGNDLDKNVAEMTDALKDVTCVEITTAVRDVELNGVDVKEGQLIGLVNGNLVASGVELEAILRSTMSALHDSDPELLTVFTGEDATTDSTRVLQTTAEELYPDAEIEVVAGNQPHYQFIIAVE